MASIEETTKAVQERLAEDPAALVEELAAELVKRKESADALAAEVATWKTEAARSERYIQLVLWKYRHIAPSLSVTITPMDIEAMSKSLEFTKQKPKIAILGSLEHQIVVMVDEHGNAITPVESNENDYDKGVMARKLQAIRESAPQLAARVKNNAMMGEFSMSDVNDLAEAVLVLARQS